MFPKNNIVDIVPLELTYNRLAAMPRPMTTTLNVDMVGEILGLNEFKGVKNLAVVAFSGSGIREQHFEGSVSR